MEIITYYLLKTWKLNNQISIERGLEEYGNKEISHNVEYSLHPIIQSSIVSIENSGDSLTSTKILKALIEIGFDLSGFERKSNILLDKNGVLRNACTIATAATTYLLCSIKSIREERIELHIYEQSKKSYAIFECKRVGVEEGMTKGPQTIEKAKQGAYVARVASSLQKIRTEKGEMNGIIYKSDGSYLIKPYIELLDEVIFSDDEQLLRRFILTIGIVSNHGNWFTAENHNKELKVLAQSYDWLIFLTDKGLSEFIENLLLNPKLPQFQYIKEIFLASYSEGKKKNQFTKVQMNIEADMILLDYFRENLDMIENWFNIISPKNKKLSDLRKELKALANKNWLSILK